MKTHKTILPVRWGDAVVVLLVLLSALAVFLCFLPQKAKTAPTAAVYLDGRLIDTLPLDIETEVVYTGAYHNTVTVRDGRIAVTASDCPGEDCVHSGWIHTTARSIVCLPNRLEIRITADTDDVDFVVR